VPVPGITIGLDGYKAPSFSRTDLKSFLNSSLLWKGGCLAIASMTNLGNWTGPGVRYFIALSSK